MFTLFTLCYILAQNIAFIDYGNFNFYLYFTKYATMRLNEDNYSY